jgi:hypothetical protein
VIYDVVFSLDAVEDVLRIAMAGGSKAEIINASKQIQEALRTDPATAGEHLSEGLYFIDREPLRAFYTIEVEVTSVDIVNVRRV